MASISGINRIKEMSSVSCARLRQVQALLKEDGDRTLDGILCTLGIDSRYNEGCSELANYLFFDLYKHNQKPLPEDFPDEMLDDVIILIKAESVHLYCNPVNYHYLLPYVSQWRNLHLHCLTEAEYEDEEAAEEFKISSFVSMVENCNCIGIPYSSRSHVQRFDMFMLEKWPIVQAFALEGIGAGVFFTMKYKLNDVSEQLWKTYNRLDPMSLGFLLNENLLSFEKQWSCLFSNVSVESAVSMQEMSEAQTAEPFRTYYSHGLISSNITDKSKSQQPFVLFGSHSCKEDLDNYCFNFPSEAHQVRNTGSRGGAAKHMVLHCVDPKGPLACARTYFFASTHVPYLGNNNTQQTTTEIPLLEQIYSAAVQSVLAGIKCFSINSSASKAKEVAEKTFYQALETFGLFQYRNALRSKAVFSIQAVNSEGRIIPLSDGYSRFLVKTASMVVYDIPDLLWGGRDLGSVVFSESFLESTIYIKQKDGALSSDSCFTVLTSSVPRYNCWLVDEFDVKLLHQALQLLKEDNGTCMGVPLTTKDSALVFSSSLLSTPEEAKVVFFSEGLLIVHPCYGAITLCKKHICTIKVCNGDSLSSIIVLFIEYENSLLPHLPFPLHSDDNCLSVALMPKTKGYKTFFSQVLQVWNKPDSVLHIQLMAQNKLSMEQESMYSRLLTLYEAHRPFAAHRRTTLKTVYPELLDIDRFLKHFAVSTSICDETVCIDHLEALFPNTCFKLSAREFEQMKEKVVLSIITGLPGSYKDSLCDFLVKTNQQCGSWEVYHSDMESEDFFGTHLQCFLSRLVATLSRANTKRVLLVTPGYTDVLDIIQAVMSHPDPQVQGRVCVGAVTACINPLTSFMEHRLLFPKLLEQCSQGVVNNVVFTGLTAEHKHPLLKYMQQLIRSVNPSAAFILAERGAVNRTEDVQLILSDSSFCQPQIIRARYLLYPGWWEGRFLSGCGSIFMSQHCVQFSRSLERTLFLQRCKGIKSSLRGTPFTGNIYHISGKVLFSDGNRLMEVSYNSISGILTVAFDQRSTPSPKTTHPCYLVFSGVGLTQKALKDWLRQCTKQKVTKKVKKTKGTLTPQEIKNIHVKRHLEPLPPGYFYNGHQFVSFFGEKQSFHPLMDQFVQEYLQVVNEEIELFNREVDLNVHIDLFD